MGRQSSTRLRRAFVLGARTEVLGNRCTGGSKGGGKEGRKRKGGVGLGVLYYPVKVARETWLHNKSVREGRFR